MKKSLFTIIVLSFAMNFCFSQDTISKINGSKIHSKIIEIGTTEIKYKKFNNVDGPIYVISKSEVLMIQYANGTKDVFIEVLNAKPIQDTTYAEKTEAVTRIDQQDTVLNDNDLTNMKMLGQIKKIIECQYIKSSNSDEILQSKTEHAFNKNGNCDVLKNYNVADLLTSRIEYQYNNNNKLTKQIEYNGKGDVVAKEEIKYDNNNKQIESLIIDPNGNKISFDQYKYNNQGKIKEQLKFDSTGNLIMKYSSDYDNYGNLTTIYTITPSGDIVQKVVMEYDIKSRLLATRYYTANNELMSAIENSYNKKNEIIRTETYSEDINTIHTKYKYDERGYVIEYQVSDIENDFIPVVTTISYEYDSHGNIIKAILSTSKKPTSITKREIIYY